MFAYCKNNSVNMSDDGGDRPNYICDFDGGGSSSTLDNIINTGKDAFKDALNYNSDFNRQNRLGAVVIFAAGAKEYAKEKILEKVAGGISGRATLSKKGALKNAQLPTKGKIRYVPPKNGLHPNHCRKLMEGILINLVMFGFKENLEQQVNNLSGMFSFQEQVKVN